MLREYGGREIARCPYRNCVECMFQKLATIDREKSDKKCWFALFLL